MVELNAGWAVLGKRPSSPNEYELTASSGWPVGSAEFEQVTNWVLAGAGPRGGAGEAAAFPWVVFSTVRLGKGQERFRGVSATDLAGYVDDMNRPVVQTQYACVQIARQPAVSFRALHDALKSLNLDDPPPEGLLPLRIAESVPEERVRDLDLAGFARVVEASAAVIDRKAVVVPVAKQPPSVVERMALLDAVAALLPGGASWLTAATWWDHGLRGKRARIALSFSTKPPDDAYVLGRSPSQMLSPVAQQYRERLLDLCQRYGWEVVIEYLARQRLDSRPSASEALDLLSDLDLPRVVLADVEEGRSAAFTGLARLQQTDRLGELAREECDYLLGRLVPLASAEELRQIGGLWAAGSPNNYEMLLRVAGKRLWEDGWDAPSMDLFRDAATRLGRDPELLIPRLYQAPGSSACRPQVQRTVEDLLIREDPFGIGDGTRWLVRAWPGLALGLILRNGSRPDTAAEWLRLAPAPSSLPSQEALALEAVRAVLEPSEARCVTEQHLDAFRELRADEAVIDWFRLIGSTSPPGAQELVGEVLVPFLWRRADRIPGPVVAAWAGTLAASRRGDDPVQRAQLDLTLCWLRHPPADLAQAVLQRSGAVDRTYLTALEAEVRRWSFLMAAEVVAYWVAGLVPGWSEPPERGRAVMDFLTHVTGLAQGRRVPREVLDRIMGELNQNEPLRVDPVSALWLHASRGEGDIGGGWMTPQASPARDPGGACSVQPGPTRPTPEEELESLSSDAPVADVARLCRELLAETTAATTIAELARSRIRLGAQDAAQVCQDILSRQPRPHVDFDNAVAFIRLLLLSQLDPAGVEAQAQWLASLASRKALEVASVLELLAEESTPLAGVDVAELQVEVTTMMLESLRHLEQIAGSRRQRGGDVSWD